MCNDFMYSAHEIRKAALPCFPHISAAVAAFAALALPLLRCCAVPFDVVTGAEKFSHAITTLSTFRPLYNLHACMLHATRISVPAIVCVCVCWVCVSSNERGAY